MRLSILFILNLFVFSLLSAQPDIYCHAPGDQSDPNYVDWLQNTDETGPFFIKLKFHCNESDINEEVIQAAVDNLAQYYNPQGIFFGWDCKIHPNTPGTQGGNTPDPTVMSVEVLSSTGNTGYATGGAPGNAVQVTKDGLGIVLVHELGHAFGLQHVFKKNDGGNGAYGCAELVDRTNGNCDECGDCLCDTDATPTPGSSNFNYTSCTYKGFSPYNSPANYDAAGVRYNPGPSTNLNIMNYTGDCRSVFTSQQGNRMRNMLANASKLASLMHKDDPNVFMTNIHRIIENATYPDCENGSIGIGVVGGYGPFTYEWSNGETTQNLSDIGEGLYCVTVTDGCCNTITDCFVVKCQCFPGVIDMQFDAGSTNTTQNLRILFPNTTGIAFPLTVSLSNASNPITVDFGEEILFEDLVIGEYYCVTFTDANGCSFDDCFVVEGETCPGAFDVLVERLGHDVDCRPEGDGFIKIKVNPAHEQCRYTITWNTTPAQTGSVVRNLSPGTYCARIEGRKFTACQNCLMVMCWDIGETVVDPEPIEIVESFRDVCFEDDFGVTHWRGTLSLEITGGAGPYTFDWDIDPMSSNQNGSTYNFIFNEEGTYCVTITDECGSEIEYCYTVKWQRYIMVCNGKWCYWKLRDCLKAPVEPNDQFDDDNYKLSIQAYPNPFDDQINIQISSTQAERGALQIINSQGNIIFEKQIDMYEGENFEIIEQTTNLPKGMYFVQIISGSERQTIKMLKSN